MDVADGNDAGFDLELIGPVRSLRSASRVIAELRRGVSRRLRPRRCLRAADAVLAASVFHFGTLRVGEVKRALRASGYPVR